jgi:hypothetical protein
MGSAAAAGGVTAVEAAGAGSGGVGWGEGLVFGAAAGQQVGDDLLFGPAGPAPVGHAQEQVGADLAQPAGVLNCTPNADLPGFPDDDDLLVTRGPRD